MAYDSDFFEAYKAYLADPKVRRAHDSMLAFMAKRYGPQDVIDLGCGRGHEFFSHGHWLSYRGMDLDPGLENEWFIKGDYRTMSPTLPRKYSCFVSLFSTECTASWQENRKLYEKLFEENPSLQLGVVSGFYYTSKLTENPIEETGGITSWQMLPGLTPERTASKWYEEVRVTLPVPSDMFGGDVVEVWRFLERTEYKGG